MNTYSLQSKQSIGKVLSCWLLSVARLPLLREARSFAPPSHDRFAFIVDQTLLFTHCILPDLMSRKGRVEMSL